MIKRFGSTTPRQKADPLNIPPNHLLPKGSDWIWKLGIFRPFGLTAKSYAAVNLQALKVQFKMYVGFSKKISTKNGHVGGGCFACTKPFAESMFELRRHITALHSHHSHEGDVFKCICIKCSGCPSKTQTIRSISKWNQTKSIHANLVQSPVAPPSSYGSQCRVAMCSASCRRTSGLIGVLPICKSVGGTRLWFHVISRTHMSLCLCRVSILYAT